MRISLCLTSLIVLLIPGWLTYTDPTHRFTMQYPKEWTQTIKGDLLAFVGPKSTGKDRFRENVTLAVRDLSAHPMNLEQFTEYNKRGISKIYGAKSIVSQGSSTIGGHKCEYLVNVGSVDGQEYKCKSCWFIIGKTAYHFTYIAESAQYDSYEQTAMDIINSFSFN